MSREVPEGWKSVRVGDIAEIRTGGTPSRTEERYWSGDIPWMASGEIHQRYVSETAEKITELALKESNARILPEGSIMIALNGQGKTRGKTAILRKAMACNQSLAAIIPNASHLPEFFLFLFESMYSQLRNLTGDDARNGLNLAILKALEVTLPPLHEQRRIAEILSSVDEAIAATRAVIEQTRTVKQGVLERLLTKGIGHTRFKQTEIGEIPEEWEVKQVGQFARLQPGYAFKSAEFADSGIRLLRGSNVGVGSFDWSEGVTEYLPAERANEFSEYLLGENDIIIAMDRPFISAGFKVARLKKSDLPCLLLQRVGRLTPTEECDLDWLWQITSSGSVRRHLEKQQVGTDLPHISRSDIESCTVALPPLSEQKAIAAALEPVDTQTDLLKRSLSSGERLKTALMSDLLTGRKRVTDALPMAAE